jgi:hypothetical protein
MHKLIDRITEYPAAREALEKVTVEPNEVAPTAADALLAAPMCTVAVQ